MGLDKIIETDVTLEAATAVIASITLPSQSFYIRLIQHEPSNTWFQSMPFTGYLKPVEMDELDDYVTTHNNDFGTLTDGWKYFSTVADRKGFRSFYLVYSNKFVHTAFKHRLEVY